MASRKTRLLIEATAKGYYISYSGGIKHEWNNLSADERHEIFRHDKRLIMALASIPDDYFQRLSNFFKAVERMKRREARKQDQSASKQGLNKD